MAVYPKLIIEVLLGSQWIVAREILGIMSILFFYYCFLLVIESALIALERVKAIFLFDLVSLLLLVAVLLVFLIKSNDMLYMIWIRVGVGLLSTFLIGVLLFF